MASLRRPWSYATVVCPADSTLTFFRLCGQILPACDGDPAPDIAVTITLQTGISGESIIDPSIDAMVAPGLVYTANIPAQIDDPANPGTLIDNPDAGCWCTCPLPANQAVDPANALQATGGTSYRISVTANGQSVYAAQTFVLDYDAAIAATPDPDFACGACIPIVQLLPPPATIPATDQFCTAVTDCLTPPTLIGPVNGELTFNDGFGTPSTHQLISGDVDNQVVAGADGALYVPPTVVTGDTTYDLTGINVADGQILLSGSDGSQDPVVIVSQDPGNQLTYGADSGVYLAGGFTETLTSIEGLNTVDIGGIPTTGVLVYTDENSDTTNVPLVSTDTGNLLVTGTDGLLLVPPPDDVTTVLSGPDLVSPGALRYLDEDANTTNLPLISTDTGNTIAAAPGDGRLFSPASTLVDNGDGTFTHTNELGQPTTININDLIPEITQVDVNNSTITFTTEGGGTQDVDICQLVQDNCPANIVANGDGSFTVTGNDPANVETIPPPSAALQVFELGQAGPLVVDGAMAIQHRFYTGSAPVTVTAAWLTLGAAHTDAIVVDLAVSGTVVQTVTIPAGATFAAVPAGGFLATHPAGVSIQERVSSLGTGAGGTEFVLQVEYTR